LVLDTSPYPTLEDIKNIDIVLRNRDSNAVFKSPLKDRIKKIAKKEKIKYDFKDKYLRNKIKKNGAKGSIGTTELGRLIHATKGQLQGTTLQIPTIGYHTVNETTTKSSVESMINVLKKVYIK
jgi:putative aminopeptidase FrvX